VKKSKYNVRLLRTAEDDFTEIVTYIAEENLSAADSIADDIEKALSKLSRHPFLGRIPNEEELLKLGYRYLVVKNYLIFYTVESESICVHRIIHGARDYIKVI